MKNKMKSLNRQIKRGHVRVKFEEVIKDWVTSAITGGIEPVFEQVPYMERRSARGIWS